MKIKHHLRPLFAILIAVACLLTPLAIQAEESPPIEKIEAVFAQLDIAGAPSRIFIVNHFDVPQAQTFSDYGDYISLSRLTDIGTIEAEGDHFQIDSEPGRFYYQGEMTETRLPWSFNLSARLDGEAIELSELAGKDGELELQIEVNKTEGQEAFADYFALQIMVSLPFEHAIDARSEKGTIAMAGDASTVTFMSLPGQEDQFTVLAEVSDFAMPGVQISAVPLHFDVDVASFLSATDEFSFEQLFDAVDQMAEGAEALDQVSGDLETGITQLADGLGELQAGGDALAAGADELRGGIVDFRRGLNQYLDGVNSVAAGSVALTSGASELGQGLAALSQNSQSLVDGANGVKQGLSQLAEGLGGSEPLPADSASALTPLVEGSAGVKAGLDQLVGGLSEWKVGFSELLASGETLLAGLETVPEEAPAAVSVADYAASFQLDEATAATEPFASMLGALAEQSAALHANVTAMIELKSGLEAFIAGFNVLNESLTPLYEGITNLQTQYTTLDQGIQALQGQLALLSDAGSGASELKLAVDQLVAGQTQFVDGLNEYVQGVNSVAGGVNASDSAPGLASGLLQLGDGLNELAKQVTPLKTGVTQLQNGSRQVAAGTADYVAGVNEASTGASELKEGLIQYLTGVSELAAGIAEFKEGTDDLDSEMETRIKEEIDQILGADYEPVSFADPRNENVKSLQFIFMTEPIARD